MHGVSLKDFSRFPLNSDLERSCDPNIVFRKLREAGVQGTLIGLLFKSRCCMDIESRISFTIGQPSGYRTWKAKKAYMRVDIPVYDGKLMHTTNENILQ